MNIIRFLEKATPRRGKKASAGSHNILAMLYIRGVISDKNSQIQKQFAHDDFLWSPYKLLALLRVISLVLPMSSRGLVARNL